MVLATNVSIAAPLPAVHRINMIKLKTLQHGIIIIYWGRGKGKTSAALGGILRASGYGWKILLCQFVKGDWPSGELKTLAKFKNVKVILGGRGFVGILGDRKPKAEHRKAALETLKILTKETKSDKYDLIVLDEILGAIKDELLSEQQVIKIIKNKPPKTNLILTGHYKYPKIFKLADLVTQMRKEKHPYDKGFLAKRGIDF